MKLYPYLNFNGDCEEALHFYKNAFEGEIIQLGRYGESPMKSPEEIKDKIIHGRLKFGDVILMASDVMNKDQFNRSGDISLSLECETAEQLEQVFTKMSEGGKVTMPLQDQFWGARFGMLTDKFGIHWMFNCEKKK
jgi:PhnB protein